MIEKIRQHTFEPGAMSIIQMGEELIGNPETAINELVKNAYDADAQKCRVYFYYDQNPELSFAIITDDGNGMNETILFGEWLQPSVSSKRKMGAKSEIYKRNYLGSKGIGRLAAMAAGKVITVITKKADDSEYNWITVDRESFKEETLLSDIHFPGDKIKNYLELFSDINILSTRNIRKNNVLSNTLKDNQLDRFNKGTIIVIENLDETVLTIIRDDFLEKRESVEFSLQDTKFYKSLATLITPLNISPEIQKEMLNEGIINQTIRVAELDNNFNVFFGINILPDQNEKEIDWVKIESIPILKAFNYRVFGKVRIDGTVIGKLIYDRLDNDTKVENFEINREVIFTQNIKTKTDVGEFYFDIRIYDIGEPDNLAKLAEKSGLKSVSSFRDAFKRFQGLRVAKNGFGVKPYGEEFVDWIELSKERVQNPGHNVNTNQILGYVFSFSPKNDKLEEKTNREGFTENTAFFEVREILKAIFKNVGSRRYNYRLLHSLGRTLKSKHERPDFNHYLYVLSQTSNLEQIRTYSQKFMEDVSTSMDNLEESLTFSERLASLGTGIELVYHEMAQPISQLRTTEASLDLKKDKIQYRYQEPFLLDIASLEHSAEVLTQLRESLQPAIGRTRKKKFKPYQTFIKVCSLYKSDFETANIKPLADSYSQDIEIISQEYAFWISFLNIVNNAVYWIKKSEKPGNIQFTFEQQSIVISNNGPLIRQDIIDYIFEYGVTTKQEKYATGLGLAFTRSVLGKIGWEITAENRINGPAFILKEASNE